MGRTVTARTRLISLRPWLQVEAQKNKKKRTNNQTIKLSLKEATEGSNVESCLVCRCGGFVRFCHLFRTFGFTLRRLPFVFFNFMYVSCRYVRHGIARRAPLRPGVKGCANLNGIEKLGGVLLHVSQNLSEKNNDLSLIKTMETQNRLPLVCQEGCPR